MSRRTLAGCPIGQFSWSRGQIVAALPVAGAADRAGARLHPHAPARLVGDALHNEAISDPDGLLGFAGGSVCPTARRQVPTVDRGSDPEDGAAVGLDIPGSGGSTLFRPRSRAASPLYTRGDDRDPVSMQLARSLRPVLLAALVAACGDDSDSSDVSSGGIVTLPNLTTAPGTTATTTPTSGPEDSSGGDTTGDPSGTTGEPATTTSPGTASTTSTTTTTTSGPGTTTSDNPETTGPPPQPEGDYAAQFIPGEPNRISVRKADKMLDHCTTLIFVGPAEMSPLEYDVMLPDTWKVQGALVHKGAAGCLEFTGFPEEPLMAISGNGAATWSGACPKALDVDVLLAFPEGEQWVAAMELLQEKAVTVGGC